VIDKSFFVNWFKQYARDFPWRRHGTTPFEFLVTEMLLRQTRAPEVAKLWDRFISKYPDAKSMAGASTEELVGQLKILGFGNQKAEALLSAANWLVKYHGGEVPDTLDELLEIPHIGLYSARAILCFAFGHRIEIVDTNIQRFFARYYGLSVKPDIRRNPIVWEVAKKALPRERKKAMQHNYGLLDFTAGICKSGRPRCEICPLSSTCSWGIQQVDIQVTARKEDV
jgi:A/G-specific adenine glycosylase